MSESKPVKFCFLGQDLWHLKRLEQQQGHLFFSSHDLLIYVVYLSQMSLSTNQLQPSAKVCVCECVCVIFYFYFFLIERILLYIYIYIYIHTHFWICINDKINKKNKQAEFRTGTLNPYRERIGFIMSC